MVGADGVAGVLTSTSDELLSSSSGGLVFLSSRSSGSIIFSIENFKGHPDRIFGADCMQTLLADSIVGLFVAIGMLGGLQGCIPRGL